METKRNASSRRPWITDATKKPAAQFWGALSFGGQKSNEDVSSTADETSQRDETLSNGITEAQPREQQLSSEEVVVDPTNCPSKANDKKPTTDRILEEEDSHRHELVDDDDVTSVDETAPTQFEAPDSPSPGKNRPANTTTTSPVREIVHSYESSRQITHGISQRVEELLRILPDGHVREKIDEVEFTNYMLARKRVWNDCANAANRRMEALRNHTNMSVSLAAAQETQAQETLRQNRLRAEMEEGRRRAAQAGLILPRNSSSSTSLEDPALSMPRFGEDDDDVQSLESLDGSKPVLSVSADDIGEDDIVEEVIGEDEIEETVIVEESEEMIIEETIVEDAESLQEDLRRRKMQAEMEEGRRRAAAALKKDTEDGITIETAASTNKTTPPEDLVLLESKSDESDKPTPQSITAEITEPSPDFDQVSDVLSSVVSSVNETDSLQQTSPRKRVADIIRRDLWDKDVTVVESALQLLVDKLVHSTDGITFRNAIARNGGILAIVRAMEQHVEHSGIQIAACRALEQLALETENELAIGEVGGVEAILGAMMTHFTQIDVQDAAWSALCNCTCGNACDIMTIDTQGGMTAIVSCMKQHVENARIQSSAVGTLTNLCWNNPNRMDALVKSGGFSVMAKALQTHWENEIVRNETAHAMHVLLGGAALAHQTLQGEPNVIDELVFAGCNMDEDLDDGEYTDEEVQ